MSRDANGPSSDLMLERAGSTAAPLLATVSFALIALVLQMPANTLKWPGAAMIPLVLAGMLLIGSVQAILWAGNNETGGWALFARALYDAGTLSLIAAIVLILVPPDPVDRSRWVAIGLGSVGFGCELVWVSCAVVPDVQGFRRSNDLARWQTALDPNLDANQVSSVRNRLKDEGIATSRAALRLSNKLGHPIGSADVGA